VSSLDANFINVKNGLFDWATKELRPHTPDAFSLAQLPFLYDPDASCSVFDKYLNTTLDSDVVPLVEELLGYAIIPDTRFEKAVMLAGSGDNGKSVFIDLLIAFCGDDNVSNVALQDLEENRFRTAELHGKLVNAYADLESRALRGTGLFKAIVSGDKITAERKHTHPFAFRPYATLVFSANEIPRSPDRTHAFYKRWLIIPFKRTFTKGENADLGLRENLRNELPGIFNRAINGLHRLCAHEGFSEPTSVKEQLERYKKSNDNVKAFLAEHVRAVDSPEEFIEKKALYAAYKEYCIERGERYPASEIKFRAGLLQAFPHVTEGRDGNYGARHWKGIEFILDDNGEV
jgi:putative DNA primase/helicase